jgi:hypothetical protein
MRIKPLKLSAASFSRTGAFAHSSRIVSRAAAAERPIRWAA